MGEKSMELEYTKRIAEINQEAENDLKRQQVKINEIETTYIRQLAESESRRDRLEAELRTRKTVKNCVQDMSGHITAFINDDVVRVLREAADHKGLPKATDSTRTPDPQKPVTADSLSQYTFTAIEEYNNTALQLNTLIQVCKP